MTIDIHVDAFPPPEMAHRLEEAGVKKAQLDILSMFTLAILAGAFIGGGAIFATVVSTGLTDSGMGYGLVKFLTGLVFCLGLIAVVVAGAELFTGNNLIIMAFASSKVSLAALLRNWGIVYAGNFVGSILTALIMLLTKQYMSAGGAVGANALAIANSKCSLNFLQAIALGIMCNALVCLAVWLCFSARSTTDKILAIIFPITAFVAAGFEHSVANMYFIPIGLLIKSTAGSGFWEGIGKTATDFSSLTWSAFFFKNLLPVTIGNIIGGSGFVGLVYWFVYLLSPQRKTEPATIPWVAAVDSYFDHVNTFFKQVWQNIKPSPGKEASLRSSFTKNRGWYNQVPWRLGTLLLLVGLLFGGVITYANARSPVTLVVYAFSTQEEVLTQGIFPAFEQAWEAETGRDLTIKGVFGPSGTLAGQINLGAPADVALLSNEQHINWLKFGRQVQQDTQPVVVSTTPMVIITRPGNHMGITDFDDLTQPSLRLLHADPTPSGAGDWALLAEYGSALLESGDQAAAQTELEAIWKNVQLLGVSARATLTLFELGAGDALVTYEQDARLALARGVPLEIVIPPRTIVAQHMAVIVDDNVTATERPVAQAFVNYLLSDAGQQAFTLYYLRPANLESEAFPPLTHPFTVDELGGWSQAYTELVERLWQTDIKPHLGLESTPRLWNIKGE
jgi:formate transporter